MRINIIAISGSLRKASTNTGLLRQAIKNCPSSMKITYYPILDFPLYNDDLIINGIKPDLIQKAYEEFAKADGFLFGASCYNHSVSSPLKNVIDWLSRDKSPLRNKPLGYFHSGNNPNNYIQPALKKSVEWLNMKVFIQKRSVFLMVKGNFDSDGNLTNSKESQKIKQYLIEYQKFIENNSKKQVS